MASRPPRDTVRSDVLAQTTVAFEKEGYARASLARIAADAGYTKGAIYSSFGSKAELFAEACARVFAEWDQTVMAHLETTLASRPGGASLLDDVTDALTTTVLDGPDQWQVLLHEFRTVALHDATVAAVYEGFTQRRVDFLVSLFRANDRLARIDEHTLRRASMLGVTLGNALAVEHVLTPETVDRDAVQGSIRGLLTAVLPF